MIFRKKKKKKQHLFIRRLKFCVALAVLALVAVLANFAYQVWKKPTEVVGLFEDGFHKTPEQTWDTYQSTFVEKSTPIITPDFLAALAQMESSGNPIVRTYWKWRWTTDLDRLYAPASSSVGMFQITHGTFEEARRFCVKDGEVFRQNDDGTGPCWNNFVYSRLVPSHAIEMTSARLHYHVKRIKEASRIRAASLQQDQSLAAVIHLCGVQKGETLARARFNIGRVGRCGDHDPAGYIRRLRRLQARFKSLRERSERLVARDP